MLSTETDALHNSMPPRAIADVATQNNYFNRIEDTLNPLGLEMSCRPLVAWARQAIPSALDISGTPRGNSHRDIAVWYSPLSRGKGKLPGRVAIMCCICRTFTLGAVMQFVSPDLSGESGLSNRA